MAELRSRLDAGELDAEKLREQLEADLAARQAQEPARPSLKLIG